MRKLYTLFSLLLLMYLPITVNAANLSGFGEVDLGQNITITESTDKKGNLIYNFKVKDGAVWRGASLFAPMTLPNSDLLSNTIKLDVMLEKIIAEKISNDETFLSADKVKLLQFGTKEGASSNIKMSSSKFSFMVVNTNMTLISTPNDIKMIMFLCADSDAAYWQPTLNKIISSMP